MNSYDNQVNGEFNFFPMSISITQLKKIVGAKIHVHSKGFHCYSPIQHVIILFGEANVGNNAILCRCLIFSFFMFNVSFSVFRLIIVTIHVPSGRGSCIIRSLNFAEHSVASLFMSSSLETKLADYTESKRRVIIILNKDYID